MTAGDDEGHNTDRIAIWRFSLLTFAVAVVPVIWILYAVYCIVAVCLGSQPLWSFWLFWVIVEAAVSVAVAAMLWGLDYVDENPVFRSAEATPAALLAPGIFIALFVVFFTVAGYFAVSTKPSATYTAAGVASAILTTIALQLWGLRSTSKSLRGFKIELESETDTTKQSKIAKNVCDVMTKRDNITKYLCFSDAPFFSGMLFLTIVVAIHENAPTGANPVEVQAFVAGAIALLLLYSNIVFWLEAFADYPEAQSLLNRLPTWAMSIRHMIDPTSRMPTEPTLDWAKTKLAEMFPTAEGCTKPKADNHQI